MPKIYTKTGDSGETSLFGGKRVKKSDPRIEAIGSVDEINSTLGICASETQNSEIKTLVHQIQNKLFEIGAELANPEGVGEHSQKMILQDSDVEFLEKQIDHYQSDLPAMNQFILPGGTRSASYFHLARSVTRRTERYLTQLENTNPAIQKYLNRLSDLFFVLARAENHSAGEEDKPWQKPQ
ncbi:MAG TPA: cob(I)yrinic acid a,c-diamide adenosyltransferase [Candidatus Saccharimonadales bacterium]|nr:cob(I)yrinic acid a,c-diamide adenosyltransferase [Candidatus Saccharimonadales bacterium]